jgi:hypothetical protein
MSSSDVERAISAIKPQAAIQTQTPQGKAFIFLDKPKPLTAKQKATLARLQKRLLAVREYKRATKALMAKRGFGTAQQSEAISTRHFRRAWAIENQIASYKTRSAGDLKMKLEFLFNHPDGLEYFFDSPEMIEEVLKDALALVRNPGTFNTRAHSSAPFKGWVYTPIARGKKVIAA